MNCLVTIGGSDSAGCSGIQADLRTFAALGWHGASVVSVITAQNTRGVVQCTPVAPAAVAAQFAAVSDDLPLCGLKIGLLTCAAVAKCVSPIARKNRQRVPVVVDPVISSSTGARLIDRAVSRSLFEALLPEATVITPNADELAELTGLPVSSPKQALAAARCLLDRGCRAVLAKGGHLAQGRGVDLLVTPAIVHEFHSAFDFGDRRHTRGTGCTLAAALTAYLAEGLQLIDAVAAARRLLRQALDGGYPVGSGPGPAAMAAHPRVSPRPVGRLHVLTDTAVQQRFGHAELAAMAARGGAHAVQIRDKRLSCAALARELRQGLQSCAPFDVACLINDHVALAATLGAHGVHLGASDLPAAHARQLMHPSAMIGATANNPDQAAAAFSQPVDYLGVGPVFGTRSKANPAPVLGLERLAHIARTSPVPIIAIGGITPERVRAARDAGAHGVAVLAGVCAAGDPEAAARRYAEAVAASEPWPAAPNAPRRREDA